MAIKELFETEICPGCGWHKTPQSSGGEYNDDWEECLNPDCHYEED